MLCHRCGEVISGEIVEKNGKNYCTDCDFELRKAEFENTNEDESYKPKDFPHFTSYNNKNYANQEVKKCWKCGGSLMEGKDVCSKCNLDERRSKFMYYDDDDSYKPDSF